MGMENDWFSMPFFHVLRPTGACAIRKKWGNNDG
jgi:hypothetical protein